MSFNWFTLSVANVLYSTFVIGGLVWYKMRKLRREIMAEYADLKEQLPMHRIGEEFLKDQFGRIEETLREYNARLSEVELQLERHWNDRKG